MKYWIPVVLALAACQAPPTAPSRPDFGPVAPTDLNNQATPIVEALTTTLTITLPPSPQWRIMAGIPSLRDSSLYSVVSPTPQVVVRNMSTGACTWTVYGDTSGNITKDLVISMGNQGDAFDSPAAVSDTVMWCLEASTWHYYYFKPPTGINGVGLALVTVNGGSGGDWMGCNSAHGGVTFWCGGGWGNDYLETRRSDGTVTLLGGDMQDTLHSTSPYPPNVQLAGGPGGDCLQASPQLSVANEDCGPDYDASVGQLGSNCENVVSACQ